MTVALQGEILSLDSSTLPATGNEGEVRFDDATKAFVKWNAVALAWDSIAAQSDTGQETTDLQDIDRTISVGTSYHHPSLIIATTRTWTVNGTLLYHCSLTLNGTAVLSVAAGGLVCP